MIAVVLVCTCWIAVFKNGTMFQYARLQSNEVFTGGEMLDCNLNIRGPMRDDCSLTGYYNKTFTHVIGVSITVITKLPHDCCPKVIFVVLMVFSDFHKVCPSEGCGKTYILSGGIYKGTLEFSYN